MCFAPEDKEIESTTLHSCGGQLWIQPWGLCLGQGWGGRGHQCSGPDTGQGVAEAAQTKQFCCFFLCCQCTYRSVKPVCGWRGVCPFGVFISFPGAAFDLGGTVPYSAGLSSAKATLYEYPTLEISENVSTRNRKSLHPFFFKKVNIFRWHLWIQDQKYIGFESRKK